MNCQQSRENVRQLSNSENWQLLTRAGKRAASGNREKTCNRQTRKNCQLLRRAGKCATVVKRRKTGTSAKRGIKCFRCQTRTNMQVPTRVGENIASVRRGIKCNQCLVRENVLTAVKRGRIQSRLDFDWLNA